MCRWWREIGEAPGLWTNFKLNLKHSFDQRTFRVLSLERLQSLECLTANAYWYDCLQILQRIVAEHSSIRRLSVEGDWASDRLDTENAVANIAKTLVKFVEVDLTECSFPTKYRWDIRGELIQNVPDRTTALLKATLAASSREDSKLKILTLNGWFIEMPVDSEEEIQESIEAISYPGARCVLKVKTVWPHEDASPTFSSDDEDDEAAAWW